MINLNRKQVFHRIRMPASLMQHRALIPAQDPVQAHQNHGVVGCILPFVRHELCFFKQVIGHSLATFKRFFHFINPNIRLALTELLHYSRTVAPLIFTSFQGRQL